MNKSDKPSYGDIAHAIAKGILGSLPGGSFAAEFFNLIISPPLEKRKAELINDMNGRLTELQEKGSINFEHLSENPDFIDVVLKVTSKIIQTSDEEKKKCFQNVIVNTALGEMPEKSQAEIYLNILSDFTVWHLKILIFINNPSRWMKKNNKNLPNRSNSSIYDILIYAFPELASMEDLINYIWKDLHSLRFQDSPSIYTTMTIEGVTENRTTNFAKDFLRFITDNGDI
ncbi:hypothetical protein [Arachidicoccus terrestris]|uniref:hypothetical protein n=1 Tax=Arachidicoccus terrestris TaxID=2875539 RepID=UPI001CC6FBDD|nr:hypothetical protein [Arachidicoccus terrestris]UAY55725.1 hypothetical protein K9M52_01440 [Arachidicoccus terrestris]